MTISLDTSSKLAVDAKSIDDLQLQAKRDPEGVLQKVAQQFEALFVNMLMKSMREATPKDGLFDSQQTQFFTQMHDQQLAQEISTKGLGIADMMVKQLTRSDTVAPQGSMNRADAMLSTIQTVNNPAVLTDDHPHDQSRFLWPNAQPTYRSTPGSSVSTSQSDLSGSNLFSTGDQSEAQSRQGSRSGRSAEFIDRLTPHVKAVSQSTGIPPQFMLAQAALESGWGKHEIRRADNSPSYNLFGIKAGANWKGDVVETVTTEYIGGVPQRVVEKFRAYGSYAEAFNDYAKLLQDNPRYAKVLRSTDANSFANGLQRAGYATDPQYANKLMRILNSASLQQTRFS